MTDGLYTAGASGAEHGPKQIRWQWGTLSEDWQGVVIAYEFSLDEPAGFDEHTWYPRVSWLSTETPWTFIDETNGILLDSDGNWPIYWTASAHWSDGPNEDTYFYVDSAYFVDNWMVYTAENPRQFFYAGTNAGGTFSASNRATGQGIIWGKGLRWYCQPGFNPSDYREVWVRDWTNSTLWETDDGRPQPALFYGGPRDFDVADSSDLPYQVFGIQSWGLYPELEAAENTPADTAANLPRRRRKAHILSIPHQLRGGQL